MLINQSNIRSEIDRRRNTNLIVPKGLRLYNAKLIAIVGAVMLAALMLKDYVAAGLTWLAKMTVKIIDTPLFNIRFLQTEQMTPEDTQLPDSDILSAEGGSRDFLLYILVVVIVVLVIVFRKKILSLMRKIAGRIFGKYSVEDTVQEVYDDYTDSYEELDIRQERIVNETDKDCLKRYRKAKDNNEKIQARLQIIRYVAFKTQYGGYFHENSRTAPRYLRKSCITAQTISEHFPTATAKYGTMTSLRPPRTFFFPTAS